MEMTGANWFCFLCPSTCSLGHGRGTSRFQVSAYVLSANICLTKKQVVWCNSESRRGEYILLLMIGTWQKTWIQRDVNN